MTKSLYEQKRRIFDYAQFSVTNYIEIEFIHKQDGFRKTAFK